MEGPQGSILNEYSYQIEVKWEVIILHMDVLRWKFRCLTHLFCCLQKRMRRVRRSSVNGQSFEQDVWMGSRSSIRIRERTASDSMHVVLSQTKKPSLLFPLPKGTQWNSVEEYCLSYSSSSSLSSLWKKTWSVNEVSFAASSSSYHSSNVYPQVVSLLLEINSRAFIELECILTGNV